MSIDLARLTITEALAALQRGDFRAEELTGACLERIQALDGRLNCFISVAGDLAREQGRRADEARAAGAKLSLVGIPLGVKDLFDVAGLPTTGGARVWAGRLPGEDATAVARLRRAGAVLLGKTNLHEIALGVTNVNPHYGACRNPWDLQRVSGGSSGGSAAAVAAGLCLGALGSDTGGSIRIPAALCGVTGLKPTYGRVSLRGVIPLNWHHDHVGPLARTVEDAARLYAAMAGYDPLDAASVRRSAPDVLCGLAGGVRGWRVALAVDDYFQKVDPAVWAAVAAAAQVFVELGAWVRRTAFPEARRAAQANGLITMAEAAALYREALEQEAPPFGEDVLSRLRSGQQTSACDYALARKTGVELRRQFERFFEAYDVLLCPTVPVPAPPIEGTDAVAQANLLTRFTAPFNITGLPALSLPCGFTAQGLPVGLQIVGRPWAEARLLRAGHVYQLATDWHTRRPSL
jgi:aspartyl-tRNA(Asn)/glutamyl-tRNA(Gln) amidotransferase subunit A